MNAKRSLVLLMVTIAIFLLNARATPCTCKPPVPPTQELERSDAVFAGKVVNIKLDSVENGRQIHRVQFLVDRYWKGFSDDTITVNTDKPTGANCGFYFDPDSSYLVYAFAIEDTTSDLHGLLFTNSCTRTSLLSEASEDLSELGPFQLFQNYPNPFNPNTTIRYNLSVETLVTLSIFNALGQEVVRLVDKVQAAGEYAVQWDGKSNSEQVVASGVYFYKLITEKGTQARKMLLVR